jgi:hypothetical protein
MFLLWTKTLGKFVLNFLFFQQNYSSQISIQKHSILSVNLSMSSTKGMLHNTGSRVYCTRSNHCCCNCHCHSWPKRTSISWCSNLYRVERPQPGTATVCIYINASKSAACEPDIICDKLLRQKFTYVCLGFIPGCFPWDVSIFIRIFKSVINVWGIWYRRNKVLILRYFSSCSKSVISCSVQFCYLDLCCCFLLNCYCLRIFRMLLYLLYSVLFFQTGYF